MFKSSELLLGDARELDEAAASENTASGTALTNLEGSLPLPVLSKDKNSFVTVLCLRILLADDDS